MGSEPTTRREHSISEPTKFDGTTRVPYYTSDQVPPGAASSTTAVPRLALDGPATAASEDTPGVDVDDEPILRPYVLTGGRTRPKYAMDTTSFVKTCRLPSNDPLNPEVRMVLDLCLREPRSIAEVAITLGQPLQVTKVLLSDLIDSGLLTAPAPTAIADPAAPRLLEPPLPNLENI
ncbi:DUF742 domain-containing protein [Streptomyces nigra]|uniref:DUF742 domain-containing protein n=1 Tax=Streptomyces nigra TaxID=1827580 RepID=UPI0037D18B0F